MSWRQMVCSTQGQVIEIFIFSPQQSDMFFPHNLKMQPGYVFSSWWNESTLTMTSSWALLVAEKRFARYIQDKSLLFQNKLKHKSRPPYFSRMTSRSPLYLIQTTAELELCRHSTSTTSESSQNEWLIGPVRKMKVKCSLPSDAVEDWHAAFGVWGFKRWLHPLLEVLRNSSGFWL